LIDKSFQLKKMIREKQIIIIKMRNKVNIKIKLNQILKEKIKRKKKFKQNIYQ
jgi:hypothetical protein